jgi:hypothetical protein
MMIDELTTQTNNLRYQQTSLIMFLLLAIIMSGCVSDGTRMRLTCSEIDYANESDFDETVRYQNLSDDNQTLFKKAINGTRVDEPYTPSLSENFVKYKNDTYDCDTHNIGA